MSSFGALLTRYNALPVLSQRAVSAIVGAFVADAATRPTHWVYDTSVLESAIGDANPEFWPVSLSPFYTLPTGRRSCYSDEALVMLQSLRMHPTTFVRSDTEAALQTTTTRNSMSRKSIAGYPQASAALGDVRRRKTIESKSLTGEEFENVSWNAANKKRYSLRSPGAKKAQNDTSSVPDLAEMLMSQADESTFSIYSEEGSVASKRNTPSKKRRSSVGSTSSAMNISEPSYQSVELADESFGFNQPDARRSTVDQVDIGSLLEGLDASQGSLDLSVASRASLGAESTSSVNTMDLMNNISTMLGTPVASSTAEEGGNEAVEQREVVHEMESAINLSELSRVSSQVSSLDMSGFSNTPLESAQKKRRLSSAKSPSRSAAKAAQSPASEAGLNDSLWGNLAAARKSPRLSARKTPADTSEANLLDLSQTAQNQSMSVLSMMSSGRKNPRRETVDGMEVQDLMNDMSTERDQSLSMNSSVAAFNGRKGKGRRETVDGAQLEDLMNDLTGEHDQSLSMNSSVAGFSGRKGKGRRETVDGAQLDDLMNDLAGEHDQSLSVNSSVAGFSGRKGKSRRETVDGAQLDDLMNDLAGEHDQSVSMGDASVDLVSVPQSPAAKSPAVKSSAAKSPVAAKSPAAKSPAVLKSPAARSPAAKSPASTRPSSARKSPSRQSSVRKSPRRVARRETVDPEDMALWMDDDISEEQERSVEVIRIVGKLSGRKSPARKPRRETVDAADLDFLMGDLSSDSISVGFKKVGRDARRDTVDTADMDALMNDLSADQQDASVHHAADSRRQSVAEAGVSALQDFSAHTPDASAAMDAQADSLLGELEFSQTDETGGFDKFSGRESLDTVALLQTVSDTLHGLDTSVNTSASSFDISALGAMVQKGEQSPAADPVRTAPSTISFGIAGPRAARRETADPADLLMLVDELENEEEGGMEGVEEGRDASDYLSSSRLSAHSQSFSAAANSSTHSARSVAQAAVATIAQQADADADAHSEGGTVDARDVLNDSMSTNQSYATIATIDLLNAVQTQMEAYHQLELGDHGDSDAESEMTDASMAPLGDFLKMYTEAGEEEVAHLVAESNSRRNSSSRARSPQAPSQAATPSPASSVGSKRSSGSKGRRQSSGRDTPSSTMDDSVLDMSANLSASSGNRLLPLRGNKARASLSTSVVLDHSKGAQLKNSLRRASVGPISSSAASTLTAPTASSASKVKAKPAKIVTQAPVPAPALSPSPSPAKPAAMAAPAVSTSFNTSFNAPPPSSALKSCLSSRKQRPHDLSGLRFDLNTSLTASALKRNVVFGSPQACEFNKTSPTTNFTPLHKDTAKSLFSMAPQQTLGAGSEDGEQECVDAETLENDHIMEEWERLSNNGDFGSDEDEDYMDAIPEGSEENENDSQASRSRRSSGASSRRQSMLQPAMDLSSDSSLEASTDSSAQYFQPASAAFPALLDVSNSQLGDDVTGTVCLPGSLAELVQQNTHAASTQLNFSMQSAASEHTEEIEADLQSLMRHLTSSHNLTGKIAPPAEEAEEDNLSIASSASGSSVRGRGRGVGGKRRRMSVLQSVCDVGADLSMSQYSEEDSGALGSLIGRPSEDSSAPTATDGSLVFSEDTSEINTSTVSSRSTRSTRSSISSEAAADNSANVSADVSVSSKGSKGKGKKGSASKKAKSPVSVPVAIASFSLDVSGDAPMDLSVGEERTYNLEGTLAALVSTLHAEHAPTFEAVTTGPVAMEAEVEQQWAAEAEQTAEISMIEGAQHEHNMDCDFSALDTPRPSLMLPTFSPAMASTPPDLSASNSRVVTRRSTWVQDRSSLSDFPDSHSDMTHETFGEFSLMAANEAEEDRIREMATGVAGPDSLMSRLRNLNAGARNNSLLQCGTPSVRPDQSRMSIGIKRLSMMNTNANLNTSVNMSVHHTPAPQSVVKSHKKARKNDESPVVVPEKPPSPTPSMSNVYGNSSPSSIRYNANPMRPAKAQAAAKMQATIHAEEAPQSAAEMHTITEAVAEEESFQETEILESELNDTITDCDAAVQALRGKLFSFFSAVQTVKTGISTYRPEVQQIVRAAMTANIEAAYVDSELSQVPIPGLLMAWELSAADSEAFALHVLSTYPDCYKHQRMQFGSQDADQLWVNMCAAAVISHTSALQASNAQTADRFYNKALNRARASSQRATAVQAASTSEAQRLKAQLLETELLIDIANKLTFCRVTTFQSNCVKVTAMLSSTVDVTLVFNMDRIVDPATGAPALVVQGIEVDLVIAQDKSTPKATTAQNLFVSAYFASVMCAESTGGCLSSSVLDAVEEPYHIPPLIHKINGSISALRLALHKLPLLSSEGWRCVVAKTTPARGLFSVAVSAPRAGADVRVSVGAFVQALVTGEDSREMRLDAAEAVVTSSADPSAEVSEEASRAAVEALVRRLSA